MRHFQQIPVGALSGVFVLGVHDLQHSSLGSLAVIAERDMYRAAQPLTDLAQHPGQDPNTVPQQTGVPGLMDIGTNHSAVDPGLFSFFNAWISTPPNIEIMCLTDFDS